MIIQKKQSYVVEHISEITGKVEKYGSYYSKTQKSLKTTWYFVGIPIYSTKEILTIEG